jgi:hypothetical protein
MTSLKKQQYVIASEAMQYQEVRLLRLLNVYSAMTPCVSFINNPVHSFGLKCYKAMAFNLEFNVKIATSNLQRCPMLGL